MMKSRWLWVALLLVVIAIAAYLLRNYVSYYVITPAIFAYRIERLLIGAIPQVVFWIFLLLGGLMLAIWTLPAGTKNRRQKVELDDKYQSRAKQFSSWILDSERSEYSKWMTVRQLSLLAFELTMYQERLSPPEATAYFRKFRTKIPDRVREYILAGVSAPSFRHYSESLENYRLNALESPFDTPPEAVIDFLESRFDNGGSG